MSFNPRSLDVAFIKPLAEGFQAHHDDQTGIFKMPLYDHPYVMHMPLAIFFVCTLPLHPSLVYVAYMSMVAMLYVMQMSHRWAHMPAGALHPVVRGLQRSRLLIRESEHGEHHHPPYQRNFCIMTGLFNRPLNAIVHVFGARSHLWILVFLATCFVPIALGALIPQ